MVSTHFLALFHWFLAIAAIHLGSIAAHELGHVILGRLAGVRMAAAGFGWHRPFAWIRIGGVALYVGRPLSMGLASPAAVQPPLSRARLALFTAGGVAANAVAGALGLTAWGLGMGVWGLALAVWSAWLVVANLVPGRHPVGRGVAVENDGAGLHALRGRRSASLPDPRLIPFHEGRRDLYLAVGRPIEAVQQSLQLATARLHVLDLAGARSALEHPVLSGPVRGTFGRELEAFLRVALAVLEDPSDADAALERAAVDPASDLSIALLALDAHVTSGREAAGEADRVLDLAQRAAHGAAIQAARILRFRALGPAADVREGRQILGGLTDPFQSFEMRLALVERLAMENDSPELRAEFDLAVETGRGLVRSLGDAGARKAFSADTDRRLGLVAAKLPPAPPRPVEPRPSQAVELARVSLVCSIAGIVLLVVSAPFAATWTGGMPWWLLATAPPVLGILSLSGAAPADPADRRIVRRALLLASGILLLPILWLLMRVAVVV